MIVASLTRTASRRALPLAVAAFRPAPTASRPAVYLRSFSAAAPESESPTSFTAEQMEKDKRYAASGNVNVPESLLGGGDGHDEGYSIRGEFRDGRPSYLDMSATTPLDPRVMDAMAPYMVSYQLLPHSYSLSCPPARLPIRGDNRAADASSPYNCACSH